MCVGGFANCAGGEGVVGVNGGAEMPTLIGHLRFLVQGQGGPEICMKQLTNYKEGERWLKVGSITQ